MMRAFRAVVLLPVILLAGAATSSGQDSIPWYPDLAAAMEMASQQNRPVLIHFWAHDCIACRRLEQTVFSRASVAETINDFFIPVKVNARQNPEIALRYDVRQWPTDVVVGPSGEVLHRMLSPQDPRHYVAQLSAVAFRSGLVPRQEAGPGGSASSTEPQLAGNWASNGGSVPGVERAEARSPGNATDRPQDVAPVSVAETQAGTAEIVNQYARQHQGSHVMGPDRGAPAPRDTADAAQATDSYKPAPAQGAGPGGPANGSYGSAPPRQTQGLDSQTAQNPVHSPIYGLEQGADTVTEAPGQSSVQPRTEPTPLGLDGYCPVTLLKKNTWQRGDPRWGVIHRGRTYLFVGVRERDEFFADPDRFSPVLAGIDPVQLTDNGEVASGKRAHGVIYADQIFLFANEENLQRFWRSPERYAEPVRQAMRTGDVRSLFR